MIQKKWFISYGLGSTIEHTDVIEASSEDEAYDYAYQNAIESYESYVGLHGIPTLEEIAIEMEVDPNSEEAIDAYTDARESSVDYYAELYDPNKHDDLL